MAYRPKIGLTMRLELETGRFYLGRDYSEAIEAAGGIPVHIPLIPDPEFIRCVVGALDGVLLPGSDTDIDPAFYGEEPHPKLRKVVPEKDETELLVLAEVERLEIPLLAICYGVQSLNVSRGGTLIQDIEAQLEGCIKHQQGAPVARNSHGIRIDRDSLLFELSRGARVEAGVKVNSHHHQAIREAGNNLRAIAWAKDGVVEGIQDVRWPISCYLRGIRFSMFRSCRSSGRIFYVFDSGCRVLDVMPTVAPRRFVNPVRLLQVISKKYPRVNPENN
jgi:putative glutamine amidotransferase